MQGQVYPHRQAALRMAAGNPPQDRNVVARTRRDPLAPSFLYSRQALAYKISCREYAREMSNGGAGVALRLPFLLFE